MRTPLFVMLFIAGAAQAAPALTPESVEQPGRAVLGMRSSGPAVLRAQVLLDRANFSPGEIDAQFGSNLRTAVVGYQRAQNLRPTGKVDAETWAALERDTEPILVEYTIQDSDVAGPFAQVPEDLMDKAALPELAYQSAEEALGERFHSKPALLQRLNAGKSLAQAGETLVVPNVVRAAAQKAARVVVDRSDSKVVLLDPAGIPLAQFPASIGSEHDPLPIGQWKIKGVARDPPFHYNPKLFWDADPAHSKAEIAPGPNNPVGVVWVDLSKDHYGIHGSPEPASIGKTQSHGCIRLTNWDALALADAVAPGVPAILQD